MHEVDHSSFEVGAVLLTLRRELSFRQQSFGDSTCYVIEDASRSKFFRIGLAEYTFLSMLDGRTTIAVAVAESASRLGDTALTENQAAALGSWLIENSLASTQQSQSQTRMLESQGKLAATRRRQWLNPIMLKIPLGNPRRMIEQVHPFASWCFSSFGFAIWLMVVIVGAYQVAAHWTTLTTSSTNVLSPDNWLYLGITWSLLKLIHEGAHALVCRRYNGETREAGILFLLFIPLPYVDVTSSWRFGSKYQRVFVAAAGMYAEVFIAALAAIAFAYTDSALIQHHSFNVMLTAGLTTLLFNVNPLMKFDGYFILSDLLEIPNLATHGQQDLMYLLRRWLLGVEGSRPEWPEGKSTVIRLYGMAALAWRILICVSLCTAAAVLYHGAGIVLAVAAIAMWVLLPAYKFARYMVVGDPVNPPKRIQFLAIASAFSMFAFVVGNYVPYVQRVQLATVVDYDQVVSVRASVPGFVREIRVHCGQEVLPGDVLLTLENTDITARQTEAKLAVQQSKLDAVRFHLQGQIASYQVEKENQASLSKRLAELSEQCESLVVVASERGTILSRTIADLQGRWINAGEELVLLGDDQNRQLSAVVPQCDIAAVRAAIGKNVDVHIWGTGASLGGERLLGRIDSVAPRGSIDVQYPALSAMAGGPLAIKARKNRDADGPSGGKSAWQLLEPHFVAEVSIPNASLHHVGASKLGVGQRGVTELTTSRRTIGREFLHRITQFYDQHQQRR